MTIRKNLLRSGEYLGKRERGGDRRVTERGKRGMGDRGKDVGNGKVGKQRRGREGRGMKNEGAEKKPTMHPAYNASYTE